MSTNNILMSVCELELVLIMECHSVCEDLEGLDIHIYRFSKIMLRALI